MYCATVKLNFGYEQKMLFTVRYCKILLHCVHSDYFMFQLGFWFQIQQTIVALLYCVMS